MAKLKAGRSPGLLPRGNGKQSSRERHRDRVEQSHAGRTVGVRAIQRMIATGARAPDYRHRGLERENPVGPGATIRAARRAEKRAREIELAAYRRIALDAHRRRKRQEAIVRAMFRDVLNLSVHDEIGGSDV